MEKSHVTPNWSLLVEVGGTHTRLGLADTRRPEPSLDHVKVVETPREQFVALLSDYLKSAGMTALPYACAVAAAGRIRRVADKASVRLTNGQLAFDDAALSAGTGASKVYLVNDMAAVAAALPLLEVQGCRALWPAQAATGPRLVIGVGTGFGAAALMADGGVLETEAGHADLAGLTPQERQSVERFAPAGRSSIESLLSGTGLPRLHQILSGTEGTPAKTLVQQALAKEAAACRTLGRFSSLLGRACGNLILTHGAWGGIYLTGGVLDSMGTAFDVDAFRATLADNPAFGPELAAVPAYRIQHPHPALVGLTRIVA